MIEAMLTRKPSPEDGNLMTMSDGNIAIGGRARDRKQLRIVFMSSASHGGPAFSAGVLQGDLVTHIDDADMRRNIKEQLPSLILGPRVRSFA